MILILINNNLWVRKRFNIKPEDVQRTMKQFNLKDTILSGMCTADPVCDEKTIRSPYRTLDGSCNNIQRPSWGKSLTQFQRALPSAYADGIPKYFVMLELYLY
jgi:peroxidase